MSATLTSKGKTVASSNWLNLQKQLKGKKRASQSGSLNGREYLHEGPSKKRRKLEERPHGSNPTDISRLSITSKLAVASSSKISASIQSSTIHVETHAASKNGESIATLQKMTLGQLQHTDTQKLPGKYLAIDCEMVGLGIDGLESSLARVSVVNFHGAVILDEFVRQKERVVDYRTKWSGIREKDMVHAKPFEEVQKQVADLIKDKILIGHAVHNDLKALLLSHPRPQTRDTQIYAHKFGVCKSKYVALRHLVKDEIGVIIQGGEHSSLTDARATMAVYRLHKKEWEKASRHLLLPSPSSKETMSTTTPSSSTIPIKLKEKEEASDSESGGESVRAVKPSQPTALTGKSTVKVGYPGGGRKGVSSGLSTVVHRKGEKAGTKFGESRGEQKKAKSDWWKQLPGNGAAGGSKGSISVGVKR